MTKRLILAVKRVIFVILLVPLWLGVIGLGLGGIGLILGHQVPTLQAGARDGRWGEIGFGIMCLLIASCMVIGLPALRRASSQPAMELAETRRKRGIEMPASDPLILSIKQTTDSHILILAAERRSRLVADKYGVVERTSWDRELDYFIANVVVPHVRQRVSERAILRSSSRITREVAWAHPGTDLSRAVSLVARAVIDAEIDRYESDCPAQLESIGEYSTPAELEHWCAAQLRATGWEASVIGQAGDQGADVRARRRDAVLVLQCKLYSSPVGNAAVQEVFAGKSFHKATIAAVVSSAGFTKSARALAAQCGVHLLAPTQLQEFAAKAA